MSAPSWRQREVEKMRAKKQQERKLAEEAEQKKVQKTETNFPSVLPVTPQHSTTVFDKKFTSLASDWKQEEERERALERFRAEQEEKRANEFKGMYIFRPNNRSLSTIQVDVEEPEFVGPPPVSRNQSDNDGWIEVKKKARKQPKTLSERELAEKYNNVGRDLEDEGEHNPDLFETNRHDHY